MTIAPEVLEQRKATITKNPGGHAYDTFTAACQRCGRPMLWVQTKYIEHEVFFCSNLDCVGQK